MGVQAAIAVLLLFIVPVKADDGGVEFWGKTFTMICPAEGTFYDGDKEFKQEKESTKLTLGYENDKKGLYHCIYNDPEERYYFFYVKGKVCENCYELDGLLLLLVITVDICVTAFLMTIIYRCTKKKGSGPIQTPRAPARSAGRAPPVPSPDYESLNPHTLSQDTYSPLHKMG